MPILCTIQLPVGKEKAQIDKTLVDVSNILMDNFSMRPDQVRVSICELPKNRFMAGGVIGCDMPEFSEECPYDPE